MANLQRSVISLSTGLDFVVIHNLNWYGISIDHPLESWLSRTKEYTAASLIEYIKSKDPNFIAMTEEEFRNVKNRKSN